MMLHVVAAMAAATASQQLENPKPDYPLDSLRFPYLTDVGVGVENEDETASTLAGRMRVGNFGYIGGQIGQRRGEASFTTWRGGAHLGKRRGVVEAGADYRAGRLRADLGLTRRRDDQGSGWVVALEGGYRVGLDLEVSAGMTRDTDPQTRGLDERFLGSEFIRVRYQKGTRLEAALLATSFRQRTVGGLNIDGDRVDLRAVGVGLGAEWRGGLRYEWQTGHLGRELADFDADVTAPVPGLRWLVATAGTTQRWETEVRRFEDRVRAGLTLYTRPYRFARTSQAAARTRYLVRRAYELGINERYVFGDTALRAFRERLALSPAGSELRAELDALYAAQIADRNVPVLGLEYELVRDETLGRIDRIYEGVVGITWPLWPPASSGAVPLLTLRYRHTRSEFDSGFLTDFHSVVADVELNREVVLRILWNEPARVPLHAALQRGPPPRFEVGLVYALGR